jgi:serine/threonine protein phosphatase PrpC
MEVASSAVVETILNSFFENPVINNDTIHSCFEKANQAVLSKQTTTCKMKSTAVVLLSKNRKLAFAHVGDSRLYYFSKGKIIHQTADHSVTQMAVASGDIEISQMRFHEDRNRLLRALGGSETVRPEIYLPKVPVKNTDSFLLCSDGFWEYVYENEMEIDLLKSQTPEQWLSYMLCRLGNRINGRNDNFSVIAVSYQK